MGRTEANLSDELPDEASIGPILESLQRRLVVGDPPDFYVLPSMPQEPVKGPQWRVFAMPDQDSIAPLNYLPQTVLNNGSVDGAFSLAFFCPKCVCSFLVDF
jgi:hypothetical protein